MEKMLFINAFIFLGVTTLVANVSLDEMYQEMKNIANEKVEKATVVTKEVTQTKVSQKSEIEVVKVETPQVEIKKIEVKTAKSETKSIETKSIETKTVEIKKSTTPILAVSPVVVKVKESTPVAPVAIPSVASVPKPIAVKAQNFNTQLTIPTPPKVPEVVSIQAIDSSTEDRSIKFSKRVPPGYTGPKFGKENIIVKAVTTEAKIGEVNAGKISAYLRGELLEVADVEKRLKDAGFTILTSVKLDKKGKLVSIVFTNKELITMASKPNRGFASTLRVLVNQNEKQISITNPLYTLKGFLQDDFDKETASKILTAITSKFDKLKNSGDQLKFQLLPKYQFMSGLPYYKDTIVVAVGESLVEKLKDNKRVFFEQKLENGSVIVGVALNKRTNGFLKKIGSKNAGMLPLLVLIENGKATILDPKFYISIMYPRLTMSEFMKIATIPDAMVKDSKRVFR